MPLTPTDPAKAQVWIRGEAPNQVIDLYVPRGARGEIGPQGPLGPAVQLAVGDVAMGPAAPGTVGPQGPTGPKGDPGGIVLGTLLGTNNLNSFFTPGTYRQDTPSNATLVNNYPKANLTGLLNIFGRDGNVVIQQYMPIDGTSGAPIMYQRLSTSSTTWTPWRVFATTRVDQTAGRAIYQWDDLNNREQLVYGDTGWRDVRSLGNATNFDFTTRIINLRREGNTVRLSGQLQVLAGVTAFSYSTFLAVPTGFRVAGGIPYMVGVESTALQVRTTTALLRMLSIGNDMALQTIPGTGGLGNMAAGDVVNLSASWSTMEAWPTTLPGTAVGTIPNT